MWGDDWDQENLGADMVTAEMECMAPIAPFFHQTQYKGVYHGDMWMKYPQDIP